MDEKEAKREADQWVKRRRVVVAVQLVRFLVVQLLQL